MIVDCRSRLTQPNSVNSYLQFAYIVRLVLHVALPHKYIMVLSEQNSSSEVIAVETYLLYRLLHSTVMADANWNLCNQLLD